MPEISIVSFAYAIYALYMKFVTRTVVPGWISIVIVASLISGFQSILVGLVGEYVGRLYEEIKRRPLYLVARSYGLAAKERERGADSQP